MYIVVAGAGWKERLKPAYEATSKVVLQQILSRRAAFGNCLLPVSDKNSVLTEILYSFALRFLVKFVLSLPRIQIDA